MVSCQKKREKGKAPTGPTFLFPRLRARNYWPLAAASSADFLRSFQLYLRWNFSTRPVVSTYFILPVKNGWQAEQISTVMFLRVLRVTNLLPQPQVTVVSSYLGWMSAFMGSSGAGPGAIP